MSSVVPEPYRADGFAVRIEAAVGHALKLDALDNSGLTLMSVHPSTDQRPEDALVWLPYEKVEDFSRRIQQFTQDTNRGMPRQAALVANMETVQRALFEHLWQEDGPLPPLEERRWWELWFDPQIVESDPVATLREVATELRWPMAEVAIAVGERLVAHVQASGEELRALLSTNACPVEIRRPSFTQELHAVDRSFQKELVGDLAGRMEVASPDAPVVCVLDTGVNQEHPLLKAALHGRAHSVLPQQTAADRHGHGTEMAGIALFGDLAEPLESRGSVTLRHGLESVKILDGTSSDATYPRTYAEVTANAVATAEIEGASAGPPRARVFSMAVTRQSGDGENGVDGAPTLWSAALDALAAGTDVVAHDDRIELVGAPDPDASRLIVVSAGNIRNLTPQQIRNPEGSLDYLTMCDLSRIEEPAQAHNILAVGAFTELAEIPKDSSFAGFRPLAESGQLSPFSRTSVALTGMPVVKPDIVMEGGNLLVDPEETLLDSHDVVSVTTTHRDAFRLISSANATSAATAQAARLGALAHSVYPGLSAEAVRALLVHEARWTPPMLGSGLYKRTGAPKLPKTQLMQQVIRRYGWGVPNEERVLSSATNAVTLIVQNELVPFRRDGSSGVRLAELQLHELPWPLEQLRDLGAATVQLRVTLSYFIEPNPGRRGLRGRYSYASHRLRFAIKSPNESVDGFERRITTQAETETNAPSHAKAFEGDSNWLVGSRNRNQGSLHSDIWQGSATELADCGVLAIFPSGGWWKSHNRTDRVGLPVRYALLVSLATPEVHTDLYTPIANQLDIPILGVPKMRSEVTVGTPVQTEIGW
ncbi:S8 family peptidase [Streptomyces sp. PA03-2a]|uniref:S8 family peptidase n=1 Tax=Streptomyces sp. PA03-2a TaxID=3028701 RepID=UPI0029A263E2|nr:S8 family peptidase [Streptomyces sp. PA03-2a]MDX2727702.1 S8 family peptidase [Streptomyces sp. PA03-2a]